MTRNQREALAVKAAFTHPERQRSADPTPTPARGLQGPSDPKVTLTAELVPSHLSLLKEKNFLNDSSHCNKSETSR